MGRYVRAMQGELGALKAALAELRREQAAIAAR